MRPCINCGGTNFGEGETRGEGNVHPQNKLFRSRCSTSSYHLLRLRRGNFNEG